MSQVTVFALRPLSLLRWPGSRLQPAPAVATELAPYIVAEVTMLPQSTTNLVGKEAEQMVRLMEMLEDNDDVQKVYTNADIPEEILNNL